LVAALLCSGITGTFATETVGAQPGEQGQDTEAVEALAVASEIGDVQPGEPGQDIEAIEAVTTEPPASAEYNGYLVKLDESAIETGVDETAMEETVENVVTDDIVVVENPADVLEFADPEAVEYIEPNYKLEVLGFPEYGKPNDPRYDTDQWGIRYVGAESAWKSGYNGAGVNVAVIDTGIVEGHEDLDTSKIRDLANFTTSSALYGEHFHGSVVAGIIAADTDNGKGIAGLAHKANLMIYKVFIDNSGYLKDVIKAYDHILENNKPVDVINLSLGYKLEDSKTEQESKIEQGKIKMLTDKGVIVVASAGNSGDNAVYYPAAHDGVISVGSVNSNGAVSSYSTRNASVDVAAPGESMIGFNITPNEYYTGYGTSFAAPIVAAAAAMVKQHDRKLNSTDFLNILKSTSTDKGTKGRDDSYGYGIISLPAIIAHIEKEPEIPPTPPTPQPTVGPAYTPAPILASVINVGSAPQKDKKEKKEKKAKKVKVTFSVNGGKLAKSARVKTVTSGKTYGSLPTPKRTGYKFNGWYTGSKGGSLVKSSTVVKSSSSQTLYAHWKKK
jgi:uncharacterized repeat protein (TIGR02543 family)